MVLNIETSTSVFTVNIVASVQLPAPGSSVTKDFLNFLIVWIDFSTGGQHL